MKKLLAILLLGCLVLGSVFAGGQTDAQAADSGQVLNIAHPVLQ